MSSGGGGGRAPMAEINVTPMVDVMLVLLIIFMVAAPLLNASVDVDLPNAEAPEMGVEEEMMLLVIDEEANLSIRIVGRDPEAGGDDETPVPYSSPDDLRQTLQSNALILGADELFIQADENVRYGFVAQVLAFVRQAGVERVGLVTDPRQERPAAP
ncbi:MAG: ExbD/TolR family protein [Sandaracinaceae bacterium]